LRKPLHLVLKSGYLFRKRSELLFSRRVLRALDLAVVDIVNSVDVRTASQPCLQQQDVLSDGTEKVADDVELVGVQTIGEKDGEGVVEREPFVGRQMKNIVLRH